MCGIFFWLCEREDEAVARRAFETIVHRGPDHSGFEREGDAYWGCHRLAVIDPHNALANQPIRCNGQRAGLSAIVCNGQIYNFRDLGVGEHDVTVLLEALAHADVNADGGRLDSASARAFFERVDGDFACVATLPGGRWLLARDPAGVRPLFWLRNRTGKLVAASSETKALVPLLQYRDEEGDVIEDFPPGGVYCDGEMTGPRHMADAAAEAEAEAEAEAVQNRVRELLRDAVVKRLRHAAEGQGYVGVLLSGGLDSSLVACIAHEYLVSQGRGHELRTYSVSFEGRGVDAEYARMLVDHMGIGAQHTEVRFDMAEALAAVGSVVHHCETSDAPTIRAGIPMYLLARHIRSETPHKVILSGEGADEAFMGYPYFRLSPSAAEAGRESRRLLENIHAFDVLRADRCMSAHNLELRCPFLDEALLRYVQERVPPAFLLPSNGVEKHLLRAAHRDVYPALVATRIIDRMKEKMSHGCGLDYVPSLLRSIPNRDEDTFYRAAFTASGADRGEAALGNSVADLSASWTVPRVMPEWSTPPVDDGAADWSKHAKPDPSTLTTQELAERERRNKEEMDAKLSALLLERAAPHQYVVTEASR